MLHYYKQTDEEDDRRFNADKLYAKEQNIWRKNKITWRG
jgi:hypothetical protein